MYGISITTRKFDLRLMPASLELSILPWRISPLKGRKTTRRNSTLTLTMPVPWPMRPSDEERMSYRQMQRPIFWMILLAYLALMLSVSAWMLGFSKSSGVIWIRSEIVVL